MMENKELLKVLEGQIRNRCDKFAHYFIYPDNETYASRPIATVYVAITKTNSAVGTICDRGVSVRVSGDMPNKIIGKINAAKRLLRTFDDKGWIMHTHDKQAKDIMERLLTERIVTRYGSGYAPSYSAPTERECRILGIQE